MVDYSYCEASDVQEELQATTAFSSATTPSLTRVEQWIVEASAAINRMAGGPIGATTYEQLIDLNGEDTIQLRNSPLIEIVSLEYNNNPLGSSSGEDWDTKVEDTDFTVYTRTGEITWLRGNFNPSDGLKRIRVTYKAGYTIIPADVQTLCVKMVADRVLSSLLNANVNEGTDGGSISVGSISIVEPGAYGVQNYQRLKRELAELKAEVGKGSGVYRY